MAKTKFDKQGLRWKACGWIFIFIAILVPATVAGMRNLDVGVDLYTVTAPVRSVLSHNYDFVSYMVEDIDMENGQYVSFESGYKALIYFLSLISPDTHFVLFAIQFLIMFFVALFAYKMRDKTSMTFVIFLYMLFWYYISFSMMRQSIAMAILFFGAALFWKREYIWSIFWLLIAISMHTTSAIGIVIYGIIAISNSGMREKIKSVLYFSYALVFTCFVIFFGQIINFLSMMHAVPEDYAFYFVSKAGVEGWQMTAIMVCFVIAAFIYLIVGKRNRMDGRVVLIFLITDLLFIVLSYRSEFLYRMGYYFEYLGLFLLVPNLPLLTKDTLKRIGICLVCIVLLSSVVFRRIAVHNWANMYPYRSDILHLSLDDDKINGGDSGQPIGLAERDNMNKRQG